MGSFSIWHWVVVLVIILVIFGPGKLPDVFKQAGKGIKAFKDAAEGKEGEGKDDLSAEEEEEVRREVRRRRDEKRKQLAKADDLDDDEDEAPPVKKSARRAQSSDE